MSINNTTAFNAEEIRDTNDHDSVIVYNGEFVVKSLIIENDHDQEVTLQCWGSAHSDFSSPYPIGNSWTQSANSNDFQSCGTYHPYWKIRASYAVAPTSGNLTVHVYGVS